MYPARRLPEDHHGLLLYQKCLLRRAVKSRAREDLSDVCKECGHAFRSAEKPLPDCRRCGSSRHVRLACRCGAVALRGRYRCADCQVVHDAAGPGARAYTGQVPNHAKRGRKI
jgi:rubredoxin